MNKLSKLFLISLTVLIASTFSLLHAQSNSGESNWPRTLTLAGGTATLYPMQVESMEGDLIRYRAAISYLENGQTDPVFGAGWFESNVEIDRDKDIVHPLDFTVTETRFPAGSVDIKDELTRAVAARMPSWNLDFPVEELLASLEAAELEAKSAENLNTQPPQILYRDHPALLVTIDGEPVLRSIENSNLQAVVNTPYPLIVDGNNYYLNAADNVWYRARAATGPYQFEPKPPAAVSALVDAESQEIEKAASTEVVTASNAPEIVVVTQPSELIVTEGPAAFVPLVDDLLVLDNTEDDVFMHISSQQYYVVLAGRWYHSKSLNGPWEYRAADNLPPAFASIPPESEQAGSRVYVAGTDEAKEAVLDAQVPTTAAVARGTVDIDVAYDGEPDFEPVDGTELSYANNTASTVLQSDRLYYLVEDGVWYVSTSPDGPWEVSDYRPEEVAAISPESPVYNVKYVYVYDSTPEVVYVGYTPGYVGNYVYYNTIVYGTGWYYRPYVSPYYYYPRYSTWGFSVGYNTWSGWSFGLSWGWGPFYAGYYSGGYWHYNRPWGGYWGAGCGYWGPRGYRPRPVHHGRYAYGKGDYDRSGYRGKGYGRGGYDNGRYGHDGGNGSRGGVNGRGGWDRGGNGQYAADRNGGNGRNGAGGGRNGGNGRAGGEQGAADNGWTNRYARNDNLYRDRGQRAKVKPASEISRAGRSGSERLVANDRAAVNRGQWGAEKGGQNQVGPAKTGRNKTGPVSSSDLRAKAQVRDARVARNQDRSFADNAATPRGRANKSAATERVAQDRQRFGWESASASGDVRPARKPQASSNQRPDRAIAGRSAKQATRPVAAGSTTRERQSATRTTQPRNVRQNTSSRKNAAPQNEQRRVAPTSRTSQRSSAGVENTRQRSIAARRSQQRNVTQQASASRSSRQVSTPVRNSQARNNTQPTATQRRATRQVAPQRNTPQRSAPQRSAPQRVAAQRQTPQQRAPQRAAPQRSAPQRSAPQRSAPQRVAPQRSVPQQRAPQRAAPQRSAPQRSAPQRSAPQRAAPAPQRSAPARSAPAPKASRGGKNRGNGSRSGRKPGP